MRILIFRPHGDLRRPAGDRIPIALEGHRSRGFVKIIMSIRTATLTLNNNIEIRSVELLSLRTQNLNLTIRSARRIALIHVSFNSVLLAIKYLILPAIP